MLGEALERFPAEVEPVEVRIWIFEAGHEAEACGHCGRSRRHRPSASVKRVLAAMAERRVTEIMGKAQRLGQILIKAERAGHGAADLRDFDRMCQADPEMVAVGGDEHLGLVAQAAEGDRMDDAVAVALEDVARAARRRDRPPDGPAARLAWLRGEVAH